MLTAQEVKPLLVHEDHPVRDAAINYFRGTWSRDDHIVPLILQAYRQPRNCWRLAHDTKQTAFSGSIK